MTSNSLPHLIEQAVQSIGKTWPLYGFVTSNPLSGYEHIPFHKALPEAMLQLGNSVYPKVEIFRKAYTRGEIAHEILIPLLEKNGIQESPEYCLQLMELDHNLEIQNPDQLELNRICSKWLAAFLDEGISEWGMPGRENGFYNAWRKLAKYDKELNHTSGHPIPSTPEEAINLVLGGIPEELKLSVLKTHLSALPGWAGYIKYRIEMPNEWQAHFPISITEYLGVRLWIAKILNLNIVQKNDEKPENESSSLLSQLWLTAWEMTWQRSLFGALKTSGHSSIATNVKPDAQFVFCIDTRSEVFRRHLEKQGPYQTFGYAGFFGIAMDYKNPDSGVIRKSCPPILPSSYQVCESTLAEKQEDFKKFQLQTENRKFFKHLLKRMKNMLPATFGFVEGTGIGYGIAMFIRTVVPGHVYRRLRNAKPEVERVCEPKLLPINKANDSFGIPLSEKVAIVGSAFKLMGWREFAPLVFFVGHGSHTANNPFGSSLDCGACAAGAGRHNARMLAHLANEPAVRQALKDETGIQIPNNTVFVAGEHNTTTDEVTFFDRDIPVDLKPQMDKIREDFGRVRQQVTQERIPFDSRSVKTAEKQAGDWSETRPEWGLARNAGFIIGPRSLTEKLNLEGRCFLHSYRWDLDSEGESLEAILQGPMVVTQWINNHYYFASVDPNNFGSGSKITQNPVGQFGVVQGNGGDLKYGLPLQSLYANDSDAYHEPLRLSVFIQAPRHRVSAILNRHENLKNLIANQWIHVVVLEPEHSNMGYRCTSSFNWEPLEQQVVITDNPGVEEISNLVLSE